MKFRVMDVLDLLANPRLSSGYSMRCPTSNVRTSLRRSGSPPAESTIPFSPNDAVHDVTRVLISWVAVNNDPYEWKTDQNAYRLVDGKPVPGPTLTVLLDEDSLATALARIDGEHPDALAGAGVGAALTVV